MMRRRTFDFLLSTGGLVVAVVLFIAGGLLLWGHSFANDNVRNQLAAEQIYFPAKGSKALADPRIGPYLNKYAGQQLVTGPQAEAYADHFIKVHLSEAADGQTYAQVSQKAQADPNNAKLTGQVETLFRGETLRGLLLEAYGFWKLGQIALIAAIASFVLGGVMLLLTGLGLLHLRRTGPAEELAFSHKAAPAAAS
ncbi:hypothetical protein I6A60_35120 [Frankia sp. AgB1.9]|uniref:hypothetical protein n=1 Tax=unclassified Frankia TaxID=2632575 RepID=UPI001931A240|nr:MULTISPECIES: hypothetical protein [unclassified Frankia]MBL7493749.1 hypothetical protein [Frankia sp. AgW1.1]MBL7553044.1 hypothetical protein [Frankia sp. AgB1.9]MBL7620522.1 hypothetical protein [Frankia sp. AgB1.8]